MPQQADIMPWIQASRRRFPSGRHPGILAPPKTQGPHPMADLDDFPAYALADQRIEQATKDHLADVARLLALNIGWYQQRDGDVPQDALLQMVRAESLNDDTRALRSAGMQNLVSALAEVTGLTDDLQDASRH